MSPRESVRGVGRDHAGATDVTMRCWYALSQAGEIGLTLDQVIDKVGPSVPAGYAWRRYVRGLRNNRTAVRRNRERSGSGTRAPYNDEVADTPMRRVAAVRNLIRQTLRDMANRGNAIKRPDGHFVAARKPKSVFSDEVHDFDGSVSRRAVAEMELAREAGPLLEQVTERTAAGRNLPTMPVKFAVALRRWYEAQPAGQARLARLAAVEASVEPPREVETNAEWLKRERESRGLTRKALAREVGLSDTAIGNWERDKYQMNSGYRQLLEHYFTSHVTS